MMNLKCFAISVSYLLLVQLAFAQKFPNSLEQPPIDYTGKRFQLSQSYPKIAVPEAELPWMKINFKKEPLKYVEVVYRYILEGNIECDWAVQNNKVRKWYHVPWMHWNDPKDGYLGREFINGLTRERDSKPYELSSTQYDFVQNWAIGIYNPAGGFVIGEVWKDAENPDPSKAKFPYGSVCAKLLFTEADTISAPYLTGAPVWMANIHVSVNEKQKKVIGHLRLLQFDIAVRDPRADNETGWVLGTLVYDNSVSSSEPWNRMIPVGLMWGNDDNVTSLNVSNGEKLKESYINPAVKNKFKFGWAGRLNGPVDNPQSSCISCHATAQYPMLSNSAPDEKASNAERLHWFNKTVKSGESFTHNAVSLDYSMQLAKGIERFYMHKSLTSKEDAISKWKNKLIRFTSGGYIYVLLFTLLIFFTITKYSSEKFKSHPILTLDFALLFLRFGIGIMFIIHGFGKITGGPALWFKLGQSMANTGIYFYPELWGFMGAFAEFFGGILLLTGLFFRPAVFMMCIHISIACLKHYKSGDSIESASHAIEIWFVFLCLLMTGPGKYSMDVKLFNRSKHQIIIT